MGNECDWSQDTHFSGERTGIFVFNELLRLIIFNIQTCTLK